MDLSFNSLIAFGYPRSALSIFHDVFDANMIVVLSHPFACICFSIIFK